MVNNQYLISSWDGTKFNTMPGEALDVGIGADGSVWVAGKGGNGIHRWNGVSGWDAIEGAGLHISVGPNGLPWVANVYNEIFRRV